MKTLISTAIAAAFIFSTTTLADPISLTNSQMDQVTAGVGANNVAVAPWEALNSEPQEFTLNHLIAGDNGADHTDNLGGVAVPSAVPKSFCFAFCP